jgi:hypothetical protein
MCLCLEHPSSVLKSNSFQIPSKVSFFREACHVSSLDTQTHDYSLLPSRAPALDAVVRG